MRKLESKKIKRNRDRRNQILVGFFLLILMVFSVLGFAIQFGLGGSQQEDSQSNVVEYNGFEFSYVNGFWVLGSFAFRNNPYQTSQINIEGNLNGAYHYEDRPLFLSSESPEARNEIIVNLGLISTSVDSACLEGEICEGDYEIKSCEGDNFIIIKESVNNVIRQKGSCVFIDGASEDLTEVTDEFLFKVLGIK